MKVTLLYIFLLFLSLNTVYSAQEIKIDNNQLIVDGVPQPQLFGAEIQYFRLRGGPGKNISREKVLELWNKALDRAVEAGMNAVSFYIPWDFHEYQQGKFDFTGTADEDGDGRADYPSRDVKTFIQLVKAKGITRIMARPGPYINAEWGFLGFGAIPLWFHQMFPDSHMQNSDGLKTKLYDYHSPELLKFTRLWFQQVHDQVLKPHLGKDGPILFLQLDNETNFMWQSIFNHDYGPRAIERYQEFLRNKYHFIEDLNASHQRNWKSWSEAKPATIPGLNISEDRTWYEFQDYSMYSYLKILRNMWEDIGIKEPSIIFTLAESYNGMKDGILPNFKYRNASGQTGMMTLNLYPKTYETKEGTLMNLPFKADHDVKAMDEANDHYFGTKNEWLMGPEIQGGWWKDVPVSEKSRQQTYLSTIGHGLKALFIYYFTEGSNWQAGWAKEQINPLYENLKLSQEFAAYSELTLPPEFWKKLQKQVNEKILVGFDVYRIMRDPEFSSDTLFFDAPLDHEANPSSHYALIKKIGQQIIKPHEDFLAKAVRITDSVYILKDSKDHASSKIEGIDAIRLNAEWCGGLVGYLSQLGLSTRIHHWNISNPDELLRAKYILRQDSGRVDLEQSHLLKKFVERGGTILSFLEDSLAKDLGITFNSVSKTKSSPIKVRFQKDREFDAAGTPVQYYENLPAHCSPILWTKNQIVGFKCSVGKGQFIQLGVLFYDIYNSDWYGKISDVEKRNDFLKTLITMNPKFKMSGTDQLVSFAREVPGDNKLWITVKNGKPVENKGSLEISWEMLKRFGSPKTIQVQALMTGKTKVVNFPKNGPLSLMISLEGYGSEVLFLEPAHD
ncbi:MAG TPA: beta-galactosidase [Bacteriovoracaceae bacterium]|nr:beta-galactosidase [Bacteriovoracaceae bacterium]